MSSPHLTPDQQRRYARHLSIPEVGSEGQSKLINSSVLLIGAGGLGSPAALYLAAAGVGTLGIVDPDRVEFSNLQRQILHGTSDIGRTKLESAADRLSEINPAVKLIQHPTVFTAANALDIAKEYDVIIDGTDNFPTRYLSNDVAVFLGIPNVYGSVHRFEGQCSVFAPHLGGPCYRCMFPKPPPPGAVPSCAEAGVLGLLPGMIGTMQATEAVKLLIGAGEPLLGRLVHYDALAGKFREFTLRRDPECPVCGENPTITAPIDYDFFCGVPKTPQDGSILTPRELASLLSSATPPLLLDVREDFERDIAKLPDSIHIPLGVLPERLSELNPTEPLVVYCKAGTRSASAIAILKENGFSALSDLGGGIDAWAAEVDTDMATY